MHINMPENVKYIINKLKKTGFEAYVVGGCVRDSIMGIIPKDWDITTNAKPGEIKKIFRRSIDTGIKHGTVTLLINKSTYEVTTYRIDGNYSDGRHPDRVLFCSLLEEDLKRRDFTINAMAYNDEEGLIDRFGGVKDIQNQIIRCVGKPTERFSEDALRMLRAVRFCAALDFTLETQTCEAIKLLHANLSKVSSERIFVELDKMLRAFHPEYISAVFESGLYKYCSENFKKISRADTELFKYASKLPDKRYVRWAALMRSLEPDTAKKILKELKADNECVNKTASVVKFLKEEISGEKCELKKLLLKLGSELLETVLIIRSSDLIKYDKNIPYISDEEFNIINNTLKEIYMNKEPYRIDMLNIDGGDLINLGIKEGPEIGKLLKQLLEAVLEAPELNSKAALLSLVQNLYSGFR